MGLDNYLSSGEEVKKEYRSLGSSNYFATDRRLIDFRSKFFSERYRDMDYEHITSIRMKRSGFRSFIFLGLSLIAAGAYLEMTWLAALGVLETLFGTVFRYGRYKAVSSNGGEMTLCRHIYLTKIYEKPKKDTEDYIKELRKLRQHKLDEKNKD